MTLLNADRRAMPMRLAAGPWQHLPQMATSLDAERAGIDGALRLVESVHHFYAKMHADTDKGRSIACVQSALDTVRLRIEIAVGRA